MTASIYKGEVPPFAMIAIRDSRAFCDSLHSEHGSRTLCTVIEEAWRKVGVTTIRATPVFRPAGSSTKSITGNTCSWPNHWSIKIEGLVNGVPTGDALAPDSC